MPSQLSSALQRFTHGVREFTVAQRTIALIGIAVLVIAAIALTAWLTKPSYTPLFSGLSGADASALVDQLEAAGVSYELSDGGSTVLVPQSAVGEQRLKAAAAGLPSGESSGYALLDSMGVTASEFQQNVTYKRALEGELASTIQSMDGVRTASVRLAIPEETVFVSQKKEPTASVFVDVASGVNLSREQVKAITHLTSSSVDGLTPENVSVIGSDGRVLSAVGVGAGGGVDQQGSDYEQRVRSAIQSMLDQVVGVGNATVVVAADVSLESAERIAETFTNPDGSPVLNESTNSENYQGTGGAGGQAGGVLGPDNIAVPGGADGQGTFTSDATVRNNAVDKITETRTIPAGAVTRQSVSVAINSDAVTGLNLATISGLVATAAGIDAARGDEVAVEMVSFSTSGAQQAQAAIEAAKAAQDQANLTSLITTGVIVFGAIVVIISALVVVVRTGSRRSRESLDLGLMTELTDEAKTSQLEALGFTPVPAIVPEPVVPPQRSEEALGFDRMRAEIDALADSNPEKTAEYLRGFMEERQSV